MNQIMVLNAVMQLNLIPVKGGVSKYFSPHTIMRHQALDWDKHCKYAFGTYVQANQNNDPTNTNAPRTIDGIYLRLCWNRYGGHKIMSLETSELVIRQYVTPIRITNTVIKAVEAMAEEQGCQQE